MGCQGGRDAGFGDGCLDLGTVLPQRLTAETCMCVVFLIASVA
jgi:hypothetical protein